MKQPGRDEVKKALFVLTEGGVGDLLLSSPIMEVLKRHFRGCSVTCWANPDHAPILLGSPYVDDHLDLPRELSFIKALRHIRSRRFDLAVFPWTISRPARLAYLAGIRYRIGQAGRAMYSWTFTHPVSVRPRIGDTKSHWVECQLDYMRAVGCDVSGVRPLMWISEQEKSRAADLLSRHGADPGDRFCCMAIGRSVPLTLRNWPIDKFIAAGKLITRDLGFRLVLTGSSQESPVVAEVANGVGPEAINLAGKTDIRLLAAVISEMDVVVCPDSGPSHIAAALGVPAVSIFAMRCDFPERWRPYQDAYRIIRARGLSCTKKRCVREKCDYYECLSAIDEHEIVGAVADLTAHGARQRLRRAG